MIIYADIRSIDILLNDSSELQIPTLRINHVVTPHLILHFHVIFPWRPHKVLHINKRRKLAPPIRPRVLVRPRHPINQPIILL